MIKKTDPGKKVLEVKKVRNRPAPDFGNMSLDELCDRVKKCRYAYEDVSEIIEDKAYEECKLNGAEKTLDKIKDLARFFELMENKSEENSRDLADVYLLIGQIYQYNNSPQESVSWLSKAVIVDDRYDVPYHSLAISCLNMGQTERAIKSLEQEIAVAPGNYYSYLLLADIFEKEGRSADVEDTLKKLLARDPENIQALHRLIRFYESKDAGVDIRLLKRRLLSVSRRCNRLELIIRVFYLCRDGKFQDALKELDEWHLRTTDSAIVHLLRACIFGALKKHKEGKRELAAFRAANNGREETMMSLLGEFGDVFGRGTAKKLYHRLLSSSD